MNPPSSAVLEAPPATDEITHVGSEPTPTIKRRSPTPTTSAPAPETPRRRSGVWSFLKFMFALVVLGAIVVAAVVAWPAIRDRVFE